MPETFFSVSEELRLFALSCAAGAVIGVFFDLLRAFRRTVHHCRAAVIFEDIAFLGCYGLFVPAFASIEARGELRVYFFLGNILGFTLYFFTAGSIVTCALEKLLGALHNICAPLRGVYVLIRAKAGVKFVGSNKISPDGKKNHRFHLPKVLYMLYNKRESINRKNVNGIAGNKNKKS